MAGTQNGGLIIINSSNLLLSVHRENRHPEGRAHSVLLSSDRVRLHELDSYNLFASASRSIAFIKSFLEVVVKVSSPL